MGTAAAGARRTVNRSGEEQSSSRSAVQYQLTKPETKPDVDDDTIDYTPLVLTATYAAILLFVAQALSSMLIANYLEATLEIHFFFDLVPYVAILAPRGTFVSVITWSTAVAVACGCAGVIYGLVRHRKRPLLLYGWAAGLFMSGFLIVFQYARHRYDPPVVDIWVLAQCAGLVIATAVVFIGFKPMRPIPLVRETDDTNNAEKNDGQPAPRRPVARSTPLDPPSARHTRTTS